MPSVLSSLANTVAGVAGGVGGGYGRAHLSRHGNKFSGGAGGLPAYEDYDYNYSAGAEHYVSRLNTKLIYFEILFINIIIVILCLHPPIGQVTKLALRSPER